MGYSLLAITDGVTRVNLLATNTGLHLSDWSPLPPAAKGGGVWQDGGLSNGRRLALKKWGNVTDSFTLSVNGLSQNELITIVQDLRRLLEKAAQYWTTEWQSQPVWIEAVAACETNTRYALVYDYQAAGEGNPYAPPFVAYDKAAIEALVLGLEHGFWLSQPPGTGECVKTSSLQLNEELGPWGVNSAAPVGTVADMVVTPTGRLLALDSNGANTRVWRTDDGGATVWASSAVMAENGSSMCVELSTGYIFVATNVRIYKSTDNGATFAQVSLAAHSGGGPFLYRLNDGYLYLLDTGAGKIMRSTDHGVNWASCVGALSILGMCLGPSTSLYAMTQRAFYKSADGTTWSLLSYNPRWAASGFLCYPGDGYFYATGSQAPAPNTMLRSSDATNWTEVAAPTIDQSDLILSSMGILYLGNGADGDIYTSLPGGLGWKLVYAGVGNAIKIVEHPTLKRIYCGIAGDVISSGAVLESVGQIASCTDETRIVNKANMGQLTHIFTYDATGPVWTSNYPAAAFPFNIYPALPAVGDYCYFGSDSLAPNYGPFNNLVFNIGTPITAGVMTWEYSQGGGVWAALTVTDGTTTLSVTGVCSVHWVPPALWANQAVNGVTGLWVRAVAAAAAASPTQATRNIYTANQNSVSVAAADVTGDLPALLHSWLTNRSDSAGVAAWANRYVIGLRSDSRGTTFQSCLNFSSTQIPLGLAVAGTAITVSAASIQTATGRQYTHTGTGISTWTDQFTFTFSGTLAAAYYGRFRAFLRAQQAAGAAGDVRVRLTVRYGTGGFLATGDFVAFGGTDNWQLLDLGSILFPPASAMKTSEVGNSMVLTLQVWSSAARVVNLYDLVLIPSDEWSADLVDTTALGTVSGVGLGDMLDLDSISFPKQEKRALVRAAGSIDGLVNGMYTPIAAGPAMLQANAAQRLYVLAVRYAAGVWYSEPWVCHSARLQAAFRYLLMRGSR